MTLTPEQQQKFHAWMQEKNIHPKCPMCQQNAWQTGGISFLPNAQGSGAASVAMIEVVCGNCAYVIQFAAGKILA